MVCDIDMSQSVKLRDAIKEYETNKWKVIGQKVGKPAKVCENSIIFASNANLFTTRHASSLPRSISRICEDMTTT